MCEADQLATRQPKNKKTEVRRGVETPTLPIASIQFRLLH